MGGAIAVKGSRHAAGRGLRGVGRRVGGLLVGRPETAAGDLDHFDVVGLEALIDFADGGHLLASETVGVLCGQPDGKRCERDQQRNRGEDGCHHGSSSSECRSNHNTVAVAGRLESVEKRGGGDIDVE